MVGECFGLGDVPDGFGGEGDTEGAIGLLDEADNLTGAETGCGSGSGWQ